MKKGKFLEVRDSLNHHLKEGHSRGGSPHIPPTTALKPSNTPLPASPLLLYPHPLRTHKGFCKHTEASPISYCTVPDNRRAPATANVPAEDQLPVGLGSRNFCRKRSNLKTAFCHIMHCCSSGRGGNGWNVDLKALSVSDILLEVYDLPRRRLLFLNYLCSRHFFSSALNE